MKNKILTLILFSAFILSPSMGLALPTLNAEPDIEELVEWDLSNDSLLFTSYDLDNNGKVDFCSWRIVKTSYFSKELLEDVTKNNPDHKIFTVQYTQSNFYYIAIKEPMMYALDIDEDGSWDFIFKDPMEDGVNGNEMIHFQAPVKRFAIPTS